MVVTCEICGKQFDSFRGLNGHRNAHIKRAEGRYRVGVGQGGYSYTPIEEPCPLCGVNEENVLMIYRDDGTIEMACKRGDCDMQMVLFKPRPRSGLLSKLKNLFSAESYKPPSSAVKAAKKGLAQRKEWGRGGLSPSEAKAQGIDSGVTRARKIASGSVSRHDVRRMSAFNRHRKNNRPDKKMPDGGPTAGTIAWNLWGGTSGVNWAKKKSATMNAEELSKTSCCCGADESNPCACMKAPEPMSCRAKEPKCACYKALEKNAESEDYNSFTEEIESLINKYGTLQSYDTTFYDNLMDVSFSFRPHNPYFDDVDFDAEYESFEDFKRKMVGDRAVAGDMGYMEALEEYYQEYLEDYAGSNPESFEEFQERTLREDYESFNAENWGGDPDGQLAKALAAVREKSKRYAPTPLRLTKLPHPDQKTLKDFEADWRDLSRDSSGRWLPAGDDSTVSYDMTDTSWMTPSEYYQYVLEEPLDISDDIEDDTQTIEFQDRFVRYTAMTMSPQVIDALIEENELEIVSDLFADPSEAEGEIAFLKAVKRYQQFSERYSAE